MIANQIFVVLSAAATAVFMSTNSVAALADSQFKPKCDPCGKWDVAQCGDKMPRMPCIIKSDPPSKNCDPCGQWDDAICGNVKPAIGCPPVTCDPCDKWDTYSCGGNRPIPLIACTTLSHVPVPSSTSNPIPASTSVVPPKCDPCGTWDTAVCGTVMPMIGCVTSAPNPTYYVSSALATSTSNVTVYDSASSVLAPGLVVVFSIFSMSTLFAYI